MGTSERDAIGATLTVKQGDQIWTAWQTGGDGFLCTNQNQIHLGVGELEKVRIGDGDLAIRRTTNLFRQLQPTRVTL